MVRPKIGWHVQGPVDVSTLGNGATIARKLLEDGVRSYIPSRDLNLSPEIHFVVWTPKQGREGHLIVDRDRNSQVEVPTSSLDDPSFDLIGWYMQHLSSQWINGWNEEGSSSPHECPQTHLSSSCIGLREESSPEPTIDDDNIPDLQKLLNGSEDDDYRNAALNNDSFWDFVFGN